MNKNHAIIHHFLIAYVDKRHREINKLDPEGKDEEAQTIRAFYEVQHKTLVDFLHSLSSEELNNLEKAHQQHTN